MNRRSALAAICAALAVSPLAAGCTPAQGGTPAPSSPCPSGWHLASDGCEITGTVTPGQDIPTPAPGSAPAGTLDAYRGPR